MENEIFAEELINLAAIADTRAHYLQREFMRLVARDTADVEAYLDNAIGFGGTTDPAGGTETARLLAAIRDYRILHKMLTDASQAIAISRTIKAGN